MDFAHHLIDFIRQFTNKEQVEILIQSYGPWIYGVFFAIIFTETGVVIWPWLPGDSLLFIVGALCATAKLNIGFSWVLLTIASLSGDHSNYWIGRFFGPNVFGRFINKKYLNETHEIYERHGVYTLVIFQFAPIFRTFAPFVAGVGKMTYGKFARYNLIGVLSWTIVCIGSGYLFGNLPWVNQHFEGVIYGIVFVSLIPIFVKIAKALMGGSQGKKPARKR